MVMLAVGRKSAHFRVNQEGDQSVVSRKVALPCLYWDERDLACELNWKGCSLQDVWWV